MCIFSSSVNSVSSTQIFARSSSTSSQYLVYAMQYDAGHDLAMILPLPTPVPGYEDAVQFIDLSAYPAFFLDMQAAFPTRPLPESCGGLVAVSGPTLRVHEVGSFEASFVPRQADFGRLDPRFRLPEAAWDSLPQYADYGFAVFKLKSGSRRVHPMALEFPSRAPRRLFYPTVHVHHGRVETHAHFDHALYCQTRRAPADWRRSPRAARLSMNVEKAAGLISGDSLLYMHGIDGFLRNQDVWLED